MANEIAEAIRSASNLTAQLKQLDGMTNYGELLQAATALQEIAALLLVLAAAPAFAANFATCVLHKMPGTQNDVAAVAIYQVCRAKHGSSRPWRRARGARRAPLGSRGKASKRRWPSCAARSRPIRNMSA